MGTGAPIDRLEEYEKKVRVLRQIMSNKAKAYGRVNATANVIAVAVSAFLTFIGFSGIPRIAAAVTTVTGRPASDATVEFVFNSLVFLLFVLVTLHLVFRFSEKQSESHRHVVALTHLRNHIDDLISRSEGIYKLSEHDVDKVGVRYEALIDSLPITSDKDYYRALQDFTKKQERKMAISVGVRQLFEPDAQRAQLEGLLSKSAQVTWLLNVLRDADARLYLGGGVVRNLVWDYLHGYKHNTPIDDVDVVYFDSLSAGKEHDLQIEQLLRSRAPNIKWSVKNQARMHVANSESAYSSLTDAIAKWPETATAMAIRLQVSGTLEVIAPHGLDDLFRLIVSPTEHFQAKLEQYQLRLTRKNWAEHWPKLRFVAGNKLKGR